jgi:hypothetical protein
MKKVAVAAAICVLFGFGVQARADDRAGASLTLKASFFFPGDSVFRESYSTGPFFGAEVTVPVVASLRFWAGAELFSQTGQLSLSAEPSRVRIVPLFAGLRLQFDRSKLRPYLGAAAGYFLVREENPLGMASESGFGLVSQAGFQVRLGRAFRVDVHAGYRACTVHTRGDDPLSANIGGLSAGLGLAFFF